MKGGKGGKRPNYGSGRSESATNGYVRRWAPSHPLAMSDGYVLEHRYVLHAAGIQVPEGWHVHHINHDPADNRIENLVVLSPDDHHAAHHHVGDTVRNQHGTWEVLTPEERLERSRRRGRENQRKRAAGFRYNAGTGQWEQDARAARLYAERGRQPWPTCGR